MALIFGLSIASYGLAVLYETFYRLPLLILKVLKYSRACLLRGVPKLNKL